MSDRPPYIGWSMIALVPVRDGVLPAGADETIAECDGVAILAGSGLDDVGLDGLAAARPPRRTRRRRTRALERRPVATVIRTIDAAGAESIVLPNSPDGRDLAPRLAAAMNLPLLAGATDA